MSCLLGLTGNAAALYLIGFGFNVNYDVLQDVSYREIRYPPSQVPGDPVIWPRSKRLGGAGAFDSAPQLWEWWTSSIGCNVRKKVTGITKDANGSLLGGVTVSLFNTSTSLLVDTTVSDSNGNYTLNDPNGVNCFVVGYLAGSPDVAGTTVSNLTGV